MHVVMRCSPRHGRLFEDPWVQCKEDLNDVEPYGGEVCRLT